MAFSPWMGSLTVTTGTAQCLSTLLAAKASAGAQLPTRCQLIRIEFDLNASGELFIGNSDVASNNCGSHLVPTQEKNVFVWDSGLTLTSDWYLLSTVATQQINVTIIPAGA